ncbi:MAG TPA: MATE family efflux transporter, partial [Phaeodactylibacter sp.]|nr:MATE family efflux transporter [Phaeodactylibacter sp.]
MNREILRLAWPNILSNISVPLLSTVDTALMGHLSALHLGAIGIGSMIFNFLYWNFGFLRMGTTGLTAQAYGAANRKEQLLTLARALLLAAGLALLLLLFQKPLGRLGTELMNSPPAHQPLIMRYFLIRILAAPAALGLYVLSGWFFGMQNAKYPLYITLFVNSVNIALSWVLVKNFGWEVEGVAWGTVVAQYAGLAL